MISILTTILDAACMIFQGTKVKSDLKPTFERLQLLGHSSYDQTSEKLFSTHSLQ